MRNEQARKGQPAAVPRRPRIRKTPRARVPVPLDHPAGRRRVLLGAADPRGPRVVRDAAAGPARARLGHLRAGDPGRVGVRER